MLYLYTKISIFTLVKGEIWVNLPQKVKIRFNFSPSWATEFLFFIHPWWWNLFKNKHKKGRYRIIILTINDFSQNYRVNIKLNLVLRGNSWIYLDVLHPTSGCLWFHMNSFDWRVTRRDLVNSNSCATITVKTFAHFYGGGGFRGVWQVLLNMQVFYMFPYWGKRDIGFNFLCMYVCLSVRNKFTIP